MNPFTSTTRSRLYAVAAAVAMLGGAGTVDQDDDIRQAIVSPRALVRVHDRFIGDRPNMSLDGRYLAFRRYGADIKNPWLVIIKADGSGKPRRIHKPYGFKYAPVLLSGVAQQTGSRPQWLLARLGDANNPKRMGIFATRLDRRRARWRLWRQGPWHPAGTDRSGRFFVMVRAARGKPGPARHQPPDPDDQLWVQPINGVQPVNDGYRVAPNVRGRIISPRFGVDGRLLFLAPGRAERRLWSLWAVANRAGATATELLTGVSSYSVIRTAPSSKPAFLVQRQHLVSTVAINTGRRVTVAQSVPGLLRFSPTSKPTLTPWSQIRCGKPVHCYVPYFDVVNRRILVRAQGRWSSRRSEYAGGLYAVGY